ncbi:DUF982 domain-containing protein [Mesorhizobium sp. 8]|jgi:hypothetical protein|uniref:DUF982 domain-containing protein n=1 Tax=Mesorhizobium sp. 8 TaxID=2584466 RepID=UPI0015D67104|nr:DUF982 domain-containing protein [Mesorhizobium sp. 8]
MRDVPFDKPLTVETAHVGRYLTITGTEQAADFLLHEWPGKRGSKHRAALQAALDVLEQRKAVGEARQAFLAAAKESDVFVRDQ